MADDLLFVYSSPGPVDLAEFTDWYDNEHVPTRLATPGFGAVTRFRALDGLKPEWLATYEVKPGTLDTPAYKALWENASEREKRIMSSLSTLDRRVYSLLSDSWADGVTAASGRRRWSWRCPCRCRPRSSLTWRRTTSRSTTRCCWRCPAGGGPGGSC